MIAPNRGLCVIAILMLAGCFAPVARTEAQDIARTQLDRYCRGRCGAVALAQTQKIKDRWLVDFDGPRQKFTVTVDSAGNAKVDAWDRNLGAATTP